MADFSTPSRISVTCPARITPVLQKELEDLGFPVQKVREAGIQTTGSLYDCMRLNLELRTAHRVHYHLKDIQANNADILYKKLSEIEWEEYISARGYVSVTSVIKNESIDNDQFANLRVKDAIVDRIRKKTGERPDSGSDLNKTVVFLYWKGNKASVYLDTSGESISRRGYRKFGHLAPLQESLAAAIVLSTKWDKKSPLVNPMCGSGTIALEAALIAQNKAPGLLRPNYGIKHILGFDEEFWGDLRSELRNKALKDTPGRIIATDNDSRAIKSTQMNAKIAGLDHQIETAVCDFRETEIPMDEKGVIILNPPYGKRLGDNKKLESVYRSIGDFFKNDCTGYWAYVFTGNLDLAKHIGLRTNQRIKFYNTKLDARLLEYELY